jgi:hypothetical protein
MTGSAGHEKCVPRSPVSLSRIYVHPRHSSARPAKGLEQSDADTPNGPFSRVSSPLVQSKGAELAAFEGDYQREGHRMPRPTADPRMSNRTGSGQRQVSPHSPMPSRTNVTKKHVARLASPNGTAVKGLCPLVPKPVSTLSNVRYIDGSVQRKPVAVEPATAYRRRKSKSKKREDFLSQSSKPRSKNTRRDTN